MASKIFSRTKLFFTSFNIVINDLLSLGETCGDGLAALETIKPLKNHVFALVLGAKSMISIDFLVRTYLPQPTRLPRVHSSLTTNVTYRGQFNNFQLKLT